MVSNWGDATTGSQKQKCRKRNNPVSSMDTQAENLKWALPGLVKKIAGIVTVRTIKIKADQLSR